MGSMPEDGGVWFRVWAPNAERVAVIGDFDEWNEAADPMDTEGEGVWSVFVPGAAIGQEYRYLLSTESGELSRMDPRAREVTSSAGNSVVHDPEFAWTDETFEPPGVHELVIYEMHVGTFHDDPGGPPGTFARAIEKLPYLKALGINAVEVMPAAEFAGGFSWGYNPSHLFAIESEYGGPYAFKEFVQEAHRMGIAVILDVVYNHFGPGDLDLWRFDGWNENDLGGIYFYNDWRAGTPWGDTRPDYRREEIRRFIRDNAMMWLDEYRVDGLRWDMTAYIRNVNGRDNDPDGDIEEGWSLMQGINEEIRTSAPGKISIADAWEARKRSALGAILVFTAPGIPMIFQGQEFLEDAWFQDKDPLDWSRAETHEGIVRLYRDLIGLRRNAEGNTAGLTGAYLHVHHLDVENKVVAYHRWAEGGPGDSVVIALNLANGAKRGYEVGFPLPGEWVVRFNGDWNGYSEDFDDIGGSGVAADPDPLDELPCRGLIDLAPYSGLILSQDRRENQAFFHARFGIGRDPLESYRETIEECMYPDVFSRKPVRIAKAKKAVSDYRKATGETVGEIDLMIFFVESGNEFTLDYGDIDEPFYNALNSMYERAVKKVVKLPADQRAAFKDRLKRIMTSSSHIGWGYHDELAGDYYNAFPEDFED
jgi:1,4-alpha-glucan branching enzyme